VLGWYLYFNMAHENSHTVKDIAVVAAALTAAGITKVFPDDAFFYCIGLAGGFFGYFLIGDVFGAGGLWGAQHSEGAGA
jgi:hypothetical protein